MKFIIQSAILLAIVFSASSCGLPTALVRTAKNSLEEISKISDGTSSAYQNVR